MWSKKAPWEPVTRMNEKARRRRSREEAHGGRGGTGPPDLPVSPPDSHQPPSLPSTQSIRPRASSPNTPSCPRTCSSWLSLALPPHCLQRPPLPARDFGPRTPVPHRCSQLYSRVSISLNLLIQQGLWSTFCVREGHNEPEEHLCPPAAHRLSGRWTSPVMMEGSP